MQSLKQVVDFAYTAKARINDSNVEQLLIVSSMLQLPRLQEQCCEYLKKQIDVSNCLGIRQFASQHCCLNLQLCADEFVQENFPQVARSEEFLLLTKDQMIDIISRDSLNVRCEEDVYTAVMNWVGSDTEKRQEDLVKILEHVRLPLVTWDFLKEHVEKDSAMTSSKDCKQFLQVRSLDVI